MAYILTSSLNRKSKFTHKKKREKCSNGYLRLDAWVTQVEQKKQKRTNNLDFEAKYATLALSTLIKTDKKLITSIKAETQIKRS